MSAIDITDIPKLQEEIGEEQDSLNLKMSDSDIVSVVDQWVSLSDREFEKLDIKTRREKTRKYVFGKQLEDDKFKDYQSPYMDNIIHRNLRSLIPVGLSRIPDIIVKKGASGNQMVADKLSEVLSARVKDNNSRDALRMAYKHRPIYLIGAIKSRWNSELCKYGDFEWKWVHPNNLILDPQATDLNVFNHNFIGEYIERPVNEWLRRFPDKTEELMAELKWSEEEQAKYSKMLTPIKGIEMWFTYYEKRKNPETGKTEFKRVEAVIWKYKNVVFKKMKNPNWDWEGEDRWFSYDDTGKRNEVGVNELRNYMLGSTDIPGLTQEKVYKNFLKNPLKPYVLMGYEQWGESPLDMTSEIEQVLLAQDNYNKRGRQITEQGDTAWGKHVFSTESGLTKKDIQRMDMTNPKQAILVSGDIDKVHRFIQGTPPDPSQFANQDSIARAIDAEMGANAPLRGEVTSDVATTNQIAREGNISIIDDIVEETINKAARDMAKHDMQYIKLKYTPEHFKDLIGVFGDEVYGQLNSDMIDDGMLVEVDASGTDKLQLKREAFERGRLNLTDPLSFFKDTGASDPEKRAEMLILSQTSPELYLQRYVMGKSYEDMARQLNGQPVETPNSQPTPEPMTPQSPMPDNMNMVSTETTEPMQTNMGMNMGA